MGILGQGDLLKNKHDTAVILAGGNKWHSVPIKETLSDDIWVADIGGKPLVFKFNDATVYTRPDGRRVLYYTTKHWAPYRPYAGVLARIAQELGIERINAAGVNVLRELARYGDDPKNPHDLDSTLETMLPLKPKNPDMYADIARWVNGVDEDRRTISQPVAAAAAELDEDVADAEPDFLGRPLSEVADGRAKFLRKVNKPKGAKNSWLKVMAVLVGAGMMGGGLWYVHDLGWFDGLLPGGPAAVAAAGGGMDAACSADALRERYAKPIDLRIDQAMGTAPDCPVPPALQAEADAIDGDLVRWSMELQGLVPPECTAEALRERYVDPMNYQIAVRMGTESCGVPPGAEGEFGTYDEDVVAWMMAERGLEARVPPAGIEVTVP